MFTTNHGPVFGQQNNSNVVPHSLRIKKFVVIETGTYNQQTRRPYVTEITGAAVNQLSEAYANAGSWSAGAIAPIAGQVITPSAMPEKPIVIPNGWDTRRMRFMLEVCYQQSLGEEYNQVILGYSECDGVSMGNHLDPNMTFFIDSMTDIKMMQAMTPLGNQMISRVVDSNHLIVDNNFHSMGAPYCERLMRPADVFASITYLHLEDDQTGTMPLANSNTVNTMAKKSNRNNGTAAHYMSSILSNFTSASNEGRGFGQGSQEVMHRARELSGETLVSKDAFLSSVAKVRGSVISNMFTMNDLKRIDANVEYVTMAKRLTQVERSSTHYHGQTASWESSDRETVASTILANSVPSLVMELGMTKIVFQSTNRTIGCVPMTKVLDGDAFNNANIDLTTAANAFMSRLETTILNDISYNNTLDFAVTMWVDVLGETRIQISMNNGPNIDYVSPSFCSSMLSPVITSNQNLTHKIATDIESLTQYVGGHTNPVGYNSKSVSF
jgi:hypothetical protein